MLADVRRGFNLHLGAHGDLHQTVMRIGPGVVAVPVEAAAHWYFAANVRSGNVTVLEQIDVAESGEHIAALAESARLERKN
jgi:hypothetical protein